MAHFKWGSQKMKKRKLKKIKLKKGKNRKRRVEKEKVNSDWLVISKRENLNRETSFEWNIKWNLRFNSYFRGMIQIDFWKTHPFADFRIFRHDADRFLEKSSKKENLEDKKYLTCLVSLSFPEIGLSHHPEN